MTRTLVRLLIYLVVVGSSAVVGILVYKNIAGTWKSEHRLSLEKIEAMGKLELVRIPMRSKAVIEPRS